LHLQIETAWLCTSLYLHDCPYSPYSRDGHRQLPQARWHSGIILPDVGSAHWIEILLNVFQGFASPTSSLWCLWIFLVKAMFARYQQVQDQSLWAAHRSSESTCGPQLADRCQLVVGQGRKRKETVEISMFGTSLRWRYDSTSLLEMFRFHEDRSPDVWKMFFFWCLSCPWIPPEIPRNPFKKDRCPLLTSGFSMTFPSYVQIQALQARLRAQVLTRYRFPGAWLMRSNVFGDLAWKFHNTIYETNGTLYSIPHTIPEW
jgi:hypothetical protein